MLKLKEGDKIDWSWHVLEGKMVVVVSPVNNNANKKKY
jgi:hypothetical protein